MPTIKEVADAEAERAEAEFPDDDQAEVEADEPEADEPEADDPDEADEADEPEGPPTEQQQQAAADTIGVLGDAYTAQVMDIQKKVPLGLVECPLCPVAGFVPDQPMNDIDPQRRLVILTVMGETVPVVGPPHPQFHRCHTCEGAGMMPTGSRREEFKTEPCPTCGGKGYADKTVEQAQEIARLAGAGQPAAGVPPTPTPTPAPTSATLVTQGGYSFPFVAGGAPDPAGRLAGHPLWGQDPMAGGV